MALAQIRAQEVYSPRHAFLQLVGSHQHFYSIRCQFCDTFNIFLQLISITHMKGSNRNTSSKRMLSLQFGTKDVFLLKSQFSNVPCEDRKNWKRFVLFSRGMLSGVCFFSHLIITLTGFSGQLDICVLYPS